MKHSNKIFILIITLIGIFMLTGCSKIRLNTFDSSNDQSGSNNVKQQVKSPEDIDEPETVADETNSDIDDNNQNEASKVNTLADIQPVANTEIMIYTINAETAEIEAVTALIPEGHVINPETIVDTVIESMADKSLMVGVESVTTKNDSIIVSFDSKLLPSANVGAGVEVAILDAIAQSLIDNLTNYEKVIYRIEGNAYASGHIELELDEVYFRR